LPRGATSNLILAALPAVDFVRINATLRELPLKPKVVLHKPGDPVHYLYFPGDGFCSELTVLSDGGMVEVATIGREGVASLIGGSQGINASETMVQSPIRRCYRMPAASFAAEMQRRGPFYQLISSYSQLLTRLIMQFTACNAVHSVEQRLARWLLMAQDHMNAETFPLTQEFVAMMLGASRPTVAITAGRLQRAGLISYNRGQVTIVDREQLESAPCECYRTAADLTTAYIADLRR
jgi:CRP-like cAMP-binding protein